ncbi:MAG: glycosyltransferase family 39 protein [Acidobacteriaceae bacterium]|nr:glycosyltransferase family 39 protein [Acidobacteriaceae bacterium]
MSKNRPVTLTLLGLTVLYAAVVALQVGRHLWFDELITYHIALAPSLARIVRLVVAWDLNPPTMHILAHYSLMAFGPNALAVRLPSIVAFYAAGIFLFFYVRRKVGVAYAAIPFLLLCGSNFSYYATEARPYAMMAAAFCGLLLSWDTATSTARYRSWALAGVAVSSLGLVASHVFGPLSLFPFVAAEAYRYWTTRQADWPLYGALLLPCTGVLGYLPLVRAYSAITYYPPYFQASYHKMGAFYWNLFKAVGWAVCLGAAAACFVVRRAPRRANLSLFRPVNAIVYTLIGALPVFLNMIFMHDQGAFWPRYCITTAFALCTLFAVILGSAVSRDARAGYAATAVIACMVVIGSVALPAWEKSVKPSLSPNAATLAGIQANLPLVAASGMTFVEMGHYEQPAITDRLYYLVDRADSIRYAHSTLFDDLHGFAQALGLRGRVEQFQSFVCEHPDFLVLGTVDYPEDWLLRKLAADRASVTLIGKYPELPYKDHRLYRIALPRAGCVPPPKHDSGQSADAVSASSVL